MTEVLGEAGVETGLLHRQPVPGRPALRQLPAHARLRQAELLAGRLPLPQQALQAPGAAQRDRALPAARAVATRSRSGGCASMVGWNSIYRDSDRDYPTARVVRSGISLARRPEGEGQAVLPRRRLPSTRTSRSTRRASSRARFGARRRASREQGITPIQPFETPYSWVIDVDVDDETIERVRELYAAEIEFMDEWVGRLMNELDDQKLIDDTVVMYIVRPRPDARRARHRRQARARAPSGTSTTCRS